MRLPRPLRSALAAVLAACVVLLGLAAVSPELHEMMCHHHEHAELVAKPAAHEAGHHGSAAAHHDDDDDAGCVVKLFSAGCETPVAFNLCPPAPLHAEGVASFTELLLSRTLRGPERVCGPPAAA